MKKMIHIIMLALVIILFPAVNAYAYGSDSSCVMDEYGLLDQRQEETLSSVLKDIYDTYQADAVILITNSSTSDGRRAAARFMQEYDIGGTDNNAMCLLHQPGTREISLVFRGELQYAFDEKIQDLMLDACVEKLRADQYFEAYESIIKDYEKGLERLAAGKDIRPMDMQASGSFGGFVLLAFLGSLVVAAIPVLCMTLYQRKRMKTNVPQPNADFYSEPDDLHLKVSRDIYIHTATTRTRIQRDDDQHTGGSGGSFSVGGESFSGSSRSY